MRISWRYVDLIDKLFDLPTCVRTKGGELLWLSLVTSQEAYAKNKDGVFYYAELPDGTEERLANIDKQILEFKDWFLQSLEWYIHPSWNNENDEGMSMKKT